MLTLTWGWSITGGRRNSNDFLKEPYNMIISTILTLLFFWICTSNNPALPAPRQESATRIGNEHEPTFWNWCVFLKSLCSLRQCLVSFSQHFQNGFVCTWADFHLFFKCIFQIFWSISFALTASMVEILKGQKSWLCKAPCTLQFSFGLVKYIIIYYIVL